MNKINDGGPAFPQSWRTQPQDMGTSGATLRDYFAAKAMQAQLTAFWAMETHHGWSHDETAREAYAMADAMLAARGAQ
ncbi:hypothetical protein [Achromobacter xylosoxidans]|uniref:hypothetical protein n=1 Tax=Alcaligenes xylosoxydans xylosoxydans TaxID=85698 RepID=UPI0006C34833|nr:hypothetical protein [Achromobacter xylosoxidans]CUI53025.1 Uncharacterised protein [Achromobacter xylosoxidans]